MGELGKTEEQAGFSHLHRICLMIVTHYFLSLLAYLCFAYLT